MHKPIQTSCGTFQYRKKGVGFIALAWNYCTNVNKPVKEVCTNKVQDLSFAQVFDLLWNPYIF